MLLKWSLFQEEIKITCVQPFNCLNNLLGHTFCATSIGVKMCALQAKMKYMELSFCENAFYSHRKCYDRIERLYLNTSYKDLQAYASQVL